MLPRPKALKIPQNLALIWVCKLIRKIKQFFRAENTQKTILVLNRKTLNFPQHAFALTLWHVSGNFSK